ncbi:MAG: porin family protein [Vicinamibacterales bacterium]
MTMRLRAVLTTILIGCSGPAFAQGLSFGVKGGVNFANVTFENTDAAKGKWLPVVGIFATLPPTLGISLQPEVLYSQKGASLGDGQSSVILDYLEVPVLARRSMTAFGHRVYLAGGPSFALRLRARTRVKFDDVTEEIDTSDDVSRFEVGVAAGGGIEFGSVVVDARYTFGLTDIDKDKAADAKSRNRVLSLTGGWRF